MQMIPIPAQPLRTSYRHRHARRRARRGERARLAEILVRWSMPAMYAPSTDLPNLSLAMALIGPCGASPLLDLMYDDAA